MYTSSYTITSTVANNIIAIAKLSQHAIKKEQKKKHTHKTKQKKHKLKEKK